MSPQSGLHLQQSAWECCTLKNNTRVVFVWQLLPGRCCDSVSWPQCNRIIALLRGCVCPCYYIECKHLDCPHISHPHSAADSRSFNPVSLCRFLTHNISLTPLQIIPLLAWPQIGLSHYLLSSRVCALRLSDSLAVELCFHSEVRTDDWHVRLRSPPPSLSKQVSIPPVETQMPIHAEKHWSCAVRLVVEQLLAEMLYSGFPIIDRHLCAVYSFTFEYQ